MKRVFNPDRWQEETWNMSSECKGWFINLLIFSCNGKFIGNNFRDLAYAADITDGEEVFNRFKASFKDHLARFFKCNKEKTHLSLLKSCDIMVPAEKKPRVRKNFAPLEISDQMKPIFERWLTYKKNKGQGYKDEISVDAAYRRLIKLSKDNHIVAAEIIENAISANYAGFFAIKEVITVESTKFDKLKDAYQGAINPHQR